MMITLRLLIIIFLVCFTMACSTAPKHPPHILKMAKVMQDQIDLYPSAQSTCTSKPIYGLNGEYVRHDVRCH